MLSYAEREELERSIDEIWQIALDMGYDPYPIHFEVVPVHVIYELGAYALPARFSHWTFGRDYHRQKTSYEYGYSKIYEIVFNTDPCQAFLMDSNSMLSHKLVVAHVIGHCHFFKHNTYFGHTDRRMVEKVRLHRDRIAQYEEEFGWREVENFLDAVLCIDEHFDPTAPLLRSLPPGSVAGRTDGRTSEYDDLWSLLTPTEKPKPRQRRFPEEPEKDLLQFLARYGRELEEWQRDIVSMVREEMLYFLPQMRTKIMNEGFASLAHERILENYLIKPEDIWEFRRLHSGVLSPSPSPGSINPYYVGFQILKNIERRWDGVRDEDDEPETDWLGNVKKRPQGEGWKKVFEVCEEENDVTFLRKYLTPELVKRLDLYTYKREERDGEEFWVVQTTDWEKVRDTMVDGMTNMGVPIIRVEDADYRRHGDLLLVHAHDGKDLDIDYTEKTMRAIHRLWGRPVHLQTRLDNGDVRLTFDGEKHTQEPV
ncbi:MAG: SpoVR family protein [Capsulimonadales bacterium]|nr:SpoVR family protein [Capsulimonadales bacterium]